MLKNISICVALLLLIAGASSQGEARSAESTSQPNIVFILADDMGYGDMRALNPECVYPTPNLDRMVNQGIAFTQGYSGSSICTPTRYGLLTGRYCWRDNIGLAGNNASRFLYDGQKTVANLLRENGYDTYMIGKWHLGTSFTYKNGEVPPMRKGLVDEQIDWEADFYGGPVDHGFDYWFGISGSLDFAPFVYMENRRVTVIPTEKMAYDGQKHRFGNRKGMADPNLQPEQVLGDFARKTAKVIREHDSEKPFFIYMPLSAPHAPVVPSAEWLGKSGIGKEGDFRMEVDWVVGEVLKAIDEKGITGDTLVMFSADNGTSPACYSKLMAAGHDTSDGRRGFKSTQFEGGHRVPFIAYWPNEIEAGQTTAELVTLEDFYATCADIIGKPLPSEVADSVSFLPMFKGKKANSEDRDVIVSSISNQLIIRRGRWKLICYPEEYAVARFSMNSPAERDAFNAARKAYSRSGPDFDKPYYENVILYDIISDVAETTNVAKQYPETVSTLAKYGLQSIENGRSNRGEVLPSTIKYHQINLLKSLTQF